MKNPNSIHQACIPTLYAAFLIVTLISSHAAAQNEVVVSIQNKSNATINVFWVDESGRELPYAELPAGQTYDQPTFPGHVWHFRQNGKLVANYTAANAPAQQMVLGANKPIPPQNTPPLPARPPVAPQQPQNTPVQNTVSAAELNAAIDFRVPNTRAINRAIFDATNRERAKAGLPPFKPSLQLMNAAQMHANDMVSRNFFSHDNPYDPSKRKVKQRIEMNGFTNAKSWSENVAIAFGIQYVANTPVRIGGPGVFMNGNGQRIPPHSPASFAASVVKQWMNSPGHRRNILSREETMFGTGVAFYPDPKFNNMMTAKAVQVFGSQF